MLELVIKVLQQLLLEGGTFMSKQICELAFQGASTAVGVAGQLLNQAIEQYGAKEAVNYPNTAYRLPILLR